MPEPTPTDPLAPGPARDEVTLLIEAVAAARVAPPGVEAAFSAEAAERYLGDVVEVAVNGDDGARVALLARLLALARVAGSGRDAGAEPSAPLRRLERMLRRWERERRGGAAGPRPRPEDLGNRVAMFGGARGPAPLIGAEVVALAIAELVAVHVLAGPVAVEEGIRCVGESEPLVAAAAALLRIRGDDLAAGVYESPGATLAHVDHAAWQLEQLQRDLGGRQEALWTRALWLEVAAALVFALDAYERRDDHGERWGEVQRLAVEKMTMGRLRADPRGYDLDAAVALVRSAVLAFAGAWLDEARDGHGRTTVPIASERMLEGAARAILAAWAVGRRLAAEDVV